MDGSIRGVTERALVQPPRRDRRARDERGDFRQELDQAENGESEGPELNDTVVVPAPPRGARPVAPATQDEAGFRVDVEA